jgi:hypothetical protein
MKILKASFYAMIAVAGVTSMAFAGNAGSKGASSAAPGQKMIAAGGPTATSQGASTVSPGHQMQDAKTAGQPLTQGASIVAPGATVSKGKN